MKNTEASRQRNLEIPPIHDDTDMRLDFIRRTRDGLFQTSYPNYPTQRYWTDNPSPLITIPDGPWSSELPGARPTPEEKILLEKHCLLDAYGRPLHPWLQDMLQTSKLGVVTGRGAYWQWGPNFTADAIVITDESHPHLLLIQRSDTGRWALPGGFIDSEDACVEAAAKREALEETSYVIETPGVLIYQGVVADSRTTAHAWAETSAFLFRPIKRHEIIGGDDALRASWVPLNQVTKTLFGSHAQLVHRAILTMKESVK